MAIREFSLRVPPSCRPGEAEKTKRDITEIVEEYVEGIYRLRCDNGRVTTGDLAQYMCVSAGSATSMVKKLQQLGLVTHAPYKEIELTEEGEKLAKQLTRIHRILKCFLVDFVGLPWNDVHELACKLEHYMSVDVIDQMYEKLGCPEKCPHGNFVDPDIEDGSIRLADAEMFADVEVFKITNESYDFLKFIEDVGLLPGTKFRIVGTTEFDGLMHLDLDGSQQTVGREVSRHVWVQKTV